jgi:menaquinol-cytochrome c reductase iron-sulfur subunit
MQRRGFLESTVATLGTGVLAALAGVTGTLQLLSPIFHRTERESEWFPLGNLAEFADDHPTQKVLTLQIQDGWQTRKQNQTVFVILKGGQPIIFSSVCPHLSCPISFESEGKQFHCPCHQSFWDAKGERISGPTARGMDPLPSKVEDGEVLCQWVQYRSGLPEAVEI